MGMVLTSKWAWLQKFHVQTCYWNPLLEILDPPLSYFYKFGPSNYSAPFTESSIIFGKGHHTYMLQMGIEYVLNEVTSFLVEIHFAERELCFLFMMQS